MTARACATGGYALTRGAAGDTIDVGAGAFSDSQMVLSYPGAGAASATIDVDGWVVATVARRKACFKLVRRNDRVRAALQAVKERMLRLDAGNRIEPRGGATRALRAHAKLGSVAEGRGSCLTGACRS